MAIDYEAEKRQQQKMRDQLADDLANIEQQRRQTLAIVEERLSALPPGSPAAQSVQAELSQLADRQQRLSRLGRAADEEFGDNIRTLTKQALAEEAQRGKDDDKHGK
ncbi:MAG: hypothetical protein LKJ69_06760 [Lactobacillus sp.]|nr:hypothetical protein [Lactobacillus sp.]MCI2033090.1 hypothetical protein [Lactobacillus sp.]